MLVYAIAVTVALLVPAATRGSYRRLLEVEWRWGALLFAGLAIQILLEWNAVPRDRWHDLGFGLLVASYVLIIGCVGRNLVLRGMGVVLVGVLCNFVVIVANQGMPVDVPVGRAEEAWLQPSIKHHPQQPDDRLRVLSDIIVLGEPFDAILSFGDLILAVGLCDVAYHGSRRRRSRRPATDPGPAARAEVVGSDA
ncbi:MAG: DUF5317 family protein [Actinomycetota bacterium]